MALSSSLMKFGYAATPALISNPLGWAVLLGGFAIAAFFDARSESAPVPKGLRVSFLNATKRKIQNVFVGQGAAVLSDDRLCESTLPAGQIGSVVFPRNYGSYCLRVVFETGKVCELHNVRVDGCLLSITVGQRWGFFGPRYEISCERFGTEVSVKL